MRSIKNNPCNGCVPPKRTPTCHATCVDYAIAKAFHNAEKAEEFLKKETEAYTINAVRRNTERSRKRRRELKGYRWIE